ncbi:MAG TPA: aldehyde ferredoxin oxidoreductase [Firmicutes bacterium]|nr:aldehyde ferredoxin oxidoreductase [Bacillota bacterium]
MAARILRVNMTKLQTEWQNFPEKYKMLGGRGLTSRIVADEVPPTCHPLSPANKLIVAPGLLGGTTAPQSGRISIGGKSPLTGGVKESNAGGVIAQKLASLGIRAVVVEGEAPAGELYVLEIEENDTRLRRADDLAGKGCYEATDAIWDRYDTKAGVVIIGPAGEMRLTAAGISVTDPNGSPGRFAGRGGLGALMGAKGLKAIVVLTDKTFAAPYHDEKRFKAAAKRFVEVLRKNPVSGQTLPAFGTNGLVNVINEAGALPTRNFRDGRFEGAEKVSGERMAQLIKERGGKTGHPCHPGCVIKCSNIYNDKNGDVLVSPLEYETVWALGPHCGIDDLDAIAFMNRLCNDIGVDTIETGGAIGVAMEAGVLPFGDAQGAIELVKEIKKGTPLGRIIGSGAAVTGQVFGVRRVGVVKKQHITAYDPRSVKGMGVTYATSPMGADHTAGYSVTVNILRQGGYVDPLTAAGQVDISRNLQVATAVIDNLGLCIFIAFSFLEQEDSLGLLLEMINSKTGSRWTEADFTRLGEEILQTERYFNRRAGFSEAHDRLPDFFAEEKLPPHDVVFDVTPAELNTLFNFRQEVRKDAGKAASLR